MSSTPSPDGTTARPAAASRSGAGSGQPLSADVVLTFADTLPSSDDPAEIRLRIALRSGDVAGSSDAALRLGARCIRKSPEMGEHLLRQATAGPPLTAARAMLRLACQRHQAGDTAEARELLAAASDRTKSAWFVDGVVDEELLAVRVDVAAALALVGQRIPAVEMLTVADTELRRLRQNLRCDDPSERRLRHLAGLINLRLAQAQVDTDHPSADAAFRAASLYGNRSVAATAALELGRMLERVGGEGPDIEEQFRRAAEGGDPIASPSAMVSLGDLLCRNNRADIAEEWWERARATGGSGVGGEIARRHAGTWPDADASAIAPAKLRPVPPVVGVAPPTPLGRIASGRASADIRNPGDEQKKIKTIVVGAGTGGHYLLPGLQYDYEVVGFVDDNKDAPGVNGLPVLGAIDELSEILQAREDVRLVIFAIPTASGRARERVLRATLQCRRPMLSLPSMFELRRGHPLVTQLRPVEVHETFGDYLWLVDRAAAAIVRGRRVAITGAGSWIGRELARRVANGQARHLLLIDEAPRPLLRITGELREMRDMVDCDARIVDCAEILGLDEVFDEFRPELVFHCGALNHAPADFLPLAHAARVNILAAENVAELSQRHGATDLVLVSADRAGHRASGFDMTKALAEHTVLALNTPASPVEAGTLWVVGSSAPSPFRVSVFRLPNVWAKDGPVVGRLIDQLSSGGPIKAGATVQRRFVQAWEAAEAVLRLVGADHGGGVFAYEGGEVITIRTIAEQLIWINGLTSGRDVTIIDDPNVDSKASLELTGRQETRGRLVASHTCEVGQSRSLVKKLAERRELLAEAWTAGSSSLLAAALEPLGALDARNAVAV